MSAKLLTILLLIISNVFMTAAWYGHLKLQAAGVTRNWPLIGVILLSWGIAFLNNASAGVIIAKKCVNLPLSFQPNDSND